MSRRTIRISAEKGRDAFCAYLGCRHEDLPDGEGWGAEVLTDMSSHCGTHVDAPLHSGSRIGGQRARTIDEIGLAELYRPGLVLDVRPWVKPAEEITVEMLDRALEATGRRIDEGDAVLIRTGQERYTMTDPLFYAQPGMSRASTLHLTAQGATILGTDAVAWDLPFGVMAKKYQQTRDKQVLWDGHKAILMKEALGLADPLTEMSPVHIPRGFTRSYIRGEMFALTSSETWPLAPSGNQSSGKSVVVIRSSPPAARTWRSIAARKRSSPSVVLPRTSTSTRADAASSALK